jgi:hypothetical protein
VKHELVIALTPAISNSLLAINKQSGDVQHLQARGDSETTLSST